MDIKTTEHLLSPVVALLDLFKRISWSRLWIMQEIFCSRRRTVLVRWCKQMISVYIVHTWPIYYQETTVCHKLRNMTI